MAVAHLVAQVGSGGPPAHAHVHGSFWDAKVLLAARVLHLRMEMLVQLQLLQTGGSPALPHLERAHAPPAAAPAGVKSLILTSGEAAGPGASRAPSQQEPRPLPPRLFLDQDAESV